MKEHQHRQLHQSGGRCSERHENIKLVQPNSRRTIAKSPQHHHHNLSHLKLACTSSSNRATRRRIPLDQTIPLFKSNHRSDDGDVSEIARASDAKASEMLTRLLSQLSPLHSEATERAPSRLQAAKKRREHMEATMGQSLKVYDPRNSVSNSDINATSTTAEDIASSGRSSLVTGRGSSTGRTVMPGPKCDTGSRTSLGVPQTESPKIEVSTDRDRASISKLDRKDYSVLGDYVLENTIGHGCFSKVKMATHFPTGQKVTLPIYFKYHHLCT
jgi:hypothetical protein